MRVARREWALTGSEMLKVAVFRPKPVESLGQVGYTLRAVLRSDRSSHNFLQTGET